jgi:hypothetical protein
LIMVAWVIPLKAQKYIMLCIGNIIKDE